MSITCARESGAVQPDAQQLTMRGQTLSTPDHRVSGGAPVRRTQQFPVQDFLRSV
ncbi:MAG: hypothetical protein AAGF95_15540 [Chloroflexota bacterium]